MQLLGKQALLSWKCFCARTSFFAYLILSSAWGPSMRRIKMKTTPPSAGLRYATLCFLSCLCDCSSSESAFFSSSEMQPMSRACCRLLFFSFSSFCYTLICFHGSHMGLLCLQSEPPSQTWYLLYNDLLAVSIWMSQGPFKISKTQGGKNAYFLEPECLGMYQLYDLGNVI